MPERPSSFQESARSPESRPRFDLSTIMGLKVDDVEVPEEAEEMAEEYFRTLNKDQTSPAQLAELAYALRRQLQEDLRSVTASEAKQSLLKQDPSHAFSLAAYRKLLSFARVSRTLQTELARHQKEKDEINGTYEVFKDLESQLNTQRDDLIRLLSEMFKRAGQDPKPVHLMTRAILETKISDLQNQLDTLKQMNPDVAALIEHDTIQEYATQLRTTGFVWTKSRKKLLQDVLTGALTSRPVAALMGETGTGKTALARSASIELSSREPERTVGGDQEKFVRLLASPAIEQGKTYYEYGPLLRAMTGKSSSIDTEPSKGGGIFFDDEFNTRPTSVQRQILKFVSEARAGRKVAVPGTPLTVEVQPGFLYLAAGNPPSERYDREETGIETKREFAGNIINVEYLEQTPDNPELYQVLLASLLDQGTGRLTAVTKEETAPDWIPDSATGVSHLDDDPIHGGYIWRFAQAWSELNKAFSNQDTILHQKNPADTKAKWHLPTFILDAGVVLSWIGQYKADPKARREHITYFFHNKLFTYLLQFPEDEQQTVRKYFEHFNILGTSFNIDEVEKPPVRVLTPKDIGYLNPNVPRPKEKTPPPKFDAVDFIDPDSGDIAFVYVKRDLKDGWPSGTRLKRKDTASASLPEQGTFIGFIYNPDTKIIDETQAILVQEDGTPSTFKPNEIDEFYDLDVPPPPPTPETGTPFVYDRTKAQEYGFSELKIEKHEAAQRIIDSVYNRDPAYVVLHRAGTQDPDSTTTPPATLTVDKYKVNETKLKADWLSNCPDLPNVPEKSLWYFQALADHRLSNTIDNNDPNNLNNPTIPHIPKFGQDSFMLAMDFPEFDYDNDTEKQAALTPQTKRILKTLFNTEDPTNISSGEVNTALWSDYERRVQSDKAKAVIQELLPQGQNPDDYELRLMRYDEYARVAQSKNYGQKNFWTHFEGYYALDGGLRLGLYGGNRSRGGAARVDGDHQGFRYIARLSVRLVLSRREIPPPPPTHETGTPFAYDRTKAQEYGFSELKIEKHEAAQRIIDSVYNRDPAYVVLHRAGTPDPDSTTTPPATLTADKYKVNETKLKADWIILCPDLPNIPEKSLWYFQALAEHRLSNTIDNDDPNNLSNPTTPHIPKFGQDSFMLAMDFPEFDYDNTTEKQAALTSQTKKILKTLFNTVDPTNITRDEVNTALWSDHERRIQSDKAKAVIQTLLPQGQNPDDYELRLMRYDEYARAAQAQNYGNKNLWTYFDGYRARGGGLRTGLFGGFRGRGGAADVDSDPRDSRRGSLSVRLVLSRRETPPPPPPTPETGTPFAYDRTKAQEYGFSEMKIEKHEAAQRIIDSVYNRDPAYVVLHRAGTPDPDSTTTPPATLTADKYKVNASKLKADWASNCPDLPNAPEKSLWFFQAIVDHRLSNTIDNDDPNNLNNPTIPHIPKFGQDSFMLAMDFNEFDYDNDTEKQAALTPQTKRILKTLFNTEDPTNISRDEVNTALWSDYERRVQSDKAKAVIQGLLPPGENPDDYELRLMRYDEYARVAQSKNYGQKNFWTHFEGYHARGGGPRSGLHGGYRADGGAAYVGGVLRDYRLGYLSVRLVLSRVI